MFNKFQYAFRDHSGIAQIEIMCETLNEINKGSTVSGFFLDLAKAFDSILRTKLENVAV